MSELFWVCSGEEAPDDDAASVLIVLSREMKYLNFRYLLLSLVAVLSLAEATAAPLAVKARLDSVNLLMGRITELKLEVVQDKGTKGEFPLFANPDASGYVTVCNDSVELRTSIRKDTVDLGSGRIQINYSVPLQAFDSGYYHLPEFIYVVGNDTARSNRLALRVVPLKVAADDPIAGLASVSEPEGKSFFDFIPDWLVDWWWLMLIVVLAVGVCIWIYIRRRKGCPVVVSRPKPLPKAWDTALDELDRLKQKKLWEQGMEKEYFTYLTEILRVYLYDRFGINAMEMTSRQIMDTLRTNNDIRDKRQYVRMILDIADFVKFAKVRPLPDDNIQAFDNAVRFVKETVPAEPGITDDEYIESDPDSRSKQEKR